MFDLLRDAEVPQAGGKVHENSEEDVSVAVAGPMTGQPMLALCVFKGYLLAAVLGGFLAMIGAEAMIALGAFAVGGGVFAVAWALQMAAPGDDPLAARREPVMATER